MSLVKSVEGAGGPPPKALMDAINNLGMEAAKQGVLVESGGLAPTAMGGRVTLSSGKVTVLDGPFSESKEVIGGYAVYNLKSKAEALECKVEQFGPRHEILLGIGPVPLQKFRFSRERILNAVAAGA